MRIHLEFVLLSALLSCQGARVPPGPSGGATHSTPPATLPEPLGAAQTKPGEAPPANAHSPVPDAGRAATNELRTDPRCKSTDPHCAPLPYWSADISAEAKRAGQITPPYDPKLGREVIDVSTWEFNQGTCSGDGDCLRNGCGNHCTAWQVQPFGANCPAYDGLSDAHCGCVQGKCAWFAQVPESHFRVGVGAVKAAPPGLSAEELSRSFPMGWLERQFRNCYAGALGRLPVEVVLSFAIDGRGRLQNPEIASSDPPRTPCLLRATRQVTLPHPKLPAKQRQRVEVPLKLHLDESPLKLEPPPPE